MSTAISSRRLAWLDGELKEWQSDGLIAPDEARAIRSRYDASHRLPLTRLVLGLGAAFVAIGGIWLVAANLDRIPAGGAVRRCHRALARSGDPGRGARRAPAASG